MSVPETNARSPLPRKMATRMSSRRSSSSQYETSRSYMFQVSAFIASGRLNVIVAIRHADLAQDLVAVLAQVRRNPLHGPRRLAQLDRHPQQRNLAEHRVRPRDDHLPMPDLGM